MPEFFYRESDFPAISLSEILQKKNKSDDHMFQFIDVDCGAGGGDGYIGEVGVGACGGGYFFERKQLLLILLFFFLVLKSNFLILSIFLYFFLFSIVFWCDLICIKFANPTF